MSIDTYEILRENVRGLYDIRPMTEDASVSADSNFHMSGRMIVCNYRFTPMYFDHNPSRLRGTDNDFILVERYSSGHGRGLIEETETQIDKRTIHLMDWSRRKRTATSNVSGTSAMIPHDMVGYDPSRHPAYLSLEMGSTAGDLLNMILERFYEAAHASQINEMHFCRELIANMVRQIICGPNHYAMAETSRHAQGYLARSYIQRHLNSPTITSDHICRDLNMSRATLYRLFKDDGGVMRYIDHLKLALCFDDLQTAQPRRGEVKRVAESRGFYDSTTFNRKFRRRFHISPSDCLSLNEGFEDTNADHHTVWPINAWLDR